MKKFIVRRVLLGAMILFFVSMIIYSIERALPTSYVEGRARDMSMKQGAKPYDELVAELNAAYGLDKPVLEGYFIWLGKAVHGFCIDRYFAAVLFLCYHFEMDFLY